VYGRDLDATIRNLLDADIEGFETDLRTVAEDLVEQGVPFDEVVASLHLFEESAGEQFQKRLKLLLQGPSIYQTFDKLSHCRIIVLASAYFAGHEARASTRLHRLEAEATARAGGAALRTSFHGLVGGSAAMRRVYEQIAAVGSGRGSVLVVGESGTGKELVARALHERSSTSGRRPFIAVNCAALPRELIESELFGHRKGAYTGAASENAGLIRAASGGTLLLDEITETAPEIQAKLLRVLEERAVRPVGGAAEVPVDVRFVASTNRDPESAIAAGVLRGDLFYRLAVHRIELPALRERTEDVAPLAAHFCVLLAAIGLRSTEGIEGEALRTLERYPWPGNVRELRNAIEHALSIGRGDRITRSDLPPHVVRGAPSTPAAPKHATAADIPSFAEAERDLIARALDATGGNKLQAARLLRISRHRLYDRLRKYKIEG
jgi:transcriptional regulator with PAS, ATPase and Fis domain